MPVFGGMSKGEHNRIKIRVRTAMSSQAQFQGRYLDGRPPYGYRIADPGTHPNPPRQPPDSNSTNSNPTPPPHSSSCASSPCSRAVSAPGIRRPTGPASSRQRTRWGPSVPTCRDACFQGHRSPSAGDVLMGSGEGAGVRGREQIGVSKEPSGRPVDTSWMTQPWGWR